MAGIRQSYGFVSVVAYDIAQVFKHDSQTMQTLPQW